VGDGNANAGQILEDYEKQIQHLKKEVEHIKKDFEDWEKDHNPAPAPR
jgi:nuclear pore complex protein Nup54